MEDNPPLVPRPDSSLYGQSDSPTPALPPKNNAAPPKRPPPPRRPPPPGAGGGKAGPPVPPPPQVGGSDPFGGNVSNSGGGFADFAKFDSLDEQVINKFLRNTPQYGTDLTSLRGLYWSPRIYHNML